MNKEEIQIGDLVRYWSNGLDLRAGLVIDDEANRRRPSLRYRVYWFSTDNILHHSGNSLIKLDIPNE